MIPIVLFLLDIAVLVMVNTANDNLAKSVARAAASAKDTSSGEGSSATGYSAAIAAASQYAESPIISKPAGGSFLTAYSWNGLGTEDKQGTAWPASVPAPNIGDVGVVTSMTVHLPVPFPFLPNTIDFQAKAVEPVVSIAAGANAVPSGSGGPTGNQPIGGGGIGNGGMGGGAGGSGGNGGGGISPGGGSGGADKKAE